MMATSFGQNKQDKQLEKSLDDLFSGQFSPSTPGCVVLVNRKGETIYKKAFGSANLELNVPLKPDMVFNLASITKQFTAVAILQLAEQGKLSLDDSLQKFIPDYPSQGHAITIEHLLTHTSGIKDYLQLEWTSPFPERWDFTPRQLIDSFKTLPLSFSPGTQFLYSNSGYFLLGYIIEKVSGKSYQEYMQESLFRPLGLSHTCFDYQDRLIPGRVSGYRREDTSFSNISYWSPSIEYAAGGILSNAEDLVKWHQSLLAYQVIKKESLEKARTSYQLKDRKLTGYGYGWYLKDYNGIRSVEHQGGLPGFQTNEVYFPEEDVLIIMLSNNGNTNIDDLSVRTSSLVLNRNFQVDIPQPDSILAKYTGVYRAVADPKRTMTLLIMNGRLAAKMSEQEIVPLLFRTETKFQFKNLLNADCEFIIENGKVVRFNAEQNGHYEWVKVQ